MKWAMRRNGVMEPFMVDAFKALAKWYPGATDIVSFMLRDVFDEGVADKYKLDSEFADKYTEKARLWARAQGVSDDVMQAYWRAHWDWPSPTQLYAMIHRLRPDHKDPNIRDIAVTPKDAEEVLAVNDVIPAWRKRLIAISYHPLTRVDAVRAWDVGTLDDAGLVAAYRDMGYSQENADTLLRFHQEKRRAKKKIALGIKPADILAYVRKGLMGVDEAVPILTNLGLDEIQATQAADISRQRFSIEHRAKVAAAVRARFNRAELSGPDALAALIVAGFDPRVADAMVQTWDQQRKAKGKEAGAAQLCKWFTLGLLTVQEYRRRLVALGWSEPDADRFIGQCVVEWQEKQAKAKKGKGKSGGDGEQPSPPQQ